MELNDYQNLALVSAFYPDRGRNLIYPTLKLCGEAGEVAEKVGKLMRDERFDGVPQHLTHEMKAGLAKELGDVLWYVSAIADELGFTLEDIARLNLEKLTSRKERGTLGGSGDNR